jgi:hypothetical protein
VFFAELLGQFGCDSNESFGDIGCKALLTCFAFLCFFSNPMDFLHDVEVFMRYNCGWGGVLFAPIGGYDSA